MSLEHIIFGGEALNRNSQYSLRPGYSQKAVHGGTDAKNERDEPKSVHGFRERVFLVAERKLQHCGRNTREERCDCCQVNQVGDAELL